MEIQFFENSNFAQAGIYKKKYNKIHLSITSAKRVTG
jgi:hypothetical protein